MKLQPFLELGKQITDSPFCEIDIIDWDYRWILTDIETDFQISSPDHTIYDDTLRKNGSLEIDNLSNDNRYRNHHFVKGPPYLRHYFGVALTNSAGIDIGTLSVSDPMVKQITKEQKIQFKLLSHSVMMTLESEFSHHTTSGELKSMKKNLHRLNHDVRSPINGITGLADLLIEDKEEISVRTRDILLIKNAAQTVVEIINDTLVSGDLEENREKIVEKKKLSDVLDKINKLFYPLAQNKNVTLSLINQTNNKIEIPFNFSIKLLRIVGNLVSNAIKFSSTNSTVHVLFTDTGKRDPVTLDISVNNTGDRMSSEQIHSFNSGDPVARTIGHGENKSFGLGLQHVHQMVTEEGGSVEVENREVSKTSFSIILPIPKNDIEKDRKSNPFINIGFSKPTVNGKDDSQK